MNRIDNRTVEFTDVGETRVRDRFEELLDDGQSIALAAGIALEEEIANGWRPTPEFVGYLSEDTLTTIRKGREVILTERGAQVEGFTDVGRQGVIRCQRRGRSFADAVAHVRGRPAILA